jgi:hypothetical protein
MTTSPIVGFQVWCDLLFLHWRVPPEVVRATLPAALTVDTFAGDAWVGVVPFRMERVRPRWLPPVPGLSALLELNVRTYVRDAHGNAGVWFYSLDCDHPIAVVIARHLFHLPYLNARMQAEQEGTRRRYRCVRTGHRDAWSYAWDTSAHASPSPAVAGTLEHFLVERYRLFTADTRWRLYTGRVSHAPYRVAPATLERYDSGPATAADFVLRGAPTSVLAAQPVAVRIHTLQRVGGTDRG